jgi:uncharacterized protein with NRDE domain
MCLLVVAWFAHPRYRLLVAGNRDEFHDRSAAPLGWWTDMPGVLAGRDLQAGGTWLGVSRGGRFGVVTNVRGAGAAGAAAAAPSRGRLVPDYLAGDAAPGDFVARLSGAAAAYAGFNLLVADASTLHYASNAAGAPLRALAPGIHALGNDALDTPRPRLTRTRARFETLVRAPEADSDAFFAMLADAEPAGGEPATDLPEPLARALSAPFVRHERYGTRCSTLLRIGHDGRIEIHERRWDATGGQSGASRFAFDAAA